MITEKLFTTLDDGREVKLYRLENRYGEYAEIINYGATIYSIYVQDKNGNLGDVILGPASPEQVTDIGFSAMTVGRCANRIAYGRFELNGKTVQLECNQRGHCLHSASGNYGKQLFHREDGEDQNELCLCLTDTGAGGYGNVVETRVSFRFGDDHCLRIHYHMVSEEDTLLNPTNHAYFNLDGSADIQDHRLWIDASEYAVSGATGMPEGEIAPLAGTPMDFSTPKPIGLAFREETADFYSRRPPQMDDTFLLRHSAGSCTLSAELCGKTSGRIMKVYTDMPSMVVFTRFIKDPVTGKHGEIWEGYKAICFETEYVPNAVNCSSFAVPLFHAGQPLDSDTVFEFGILES